MSSDLRLRKLPSMTTVAVVIKKYLKDVENRDERSLVTRFRKFMIKIHGRGVKWTNVTNQDFERFLKSQSVSEGTLKKHRSLLNRLKRHFGLPTSPSHGGRKAKKKELEPIIRKYEKKLAQKNDMITRHRQTIDTLHAENEELTRRIDMMSSKRRSIHDLEKLEMEKAELVKQIAELKKTQKEMRDNVRIFKVVCHLTNRVVTLGNDCHDCLEYVKCPVVGEFLYLEEE